MLALSTSLTGAGNAAAVSACSLTPASWPAIRASLAGARTTGWVAGDGFTSARLNEHQVLFLSDDTFWGTYDAPRDMFAGTIKRNTAMLFDDRNPACFSVQSGASQGGRFPYGGDALQTWRWVGAPQVRGTTVTIQGANYRSTGGGVWDFAQDSATVATFGWDGANLLPVYERPLSPTPSDPPGRQFQWVNSTVANGYVYLSATDIRPADAGGQACCQDIYLARVKSEAWFERTPADLRTALEFLTTSGQWRVGAPYATLRRIADRIGDAAASLVWTGTEAHVIFKRKSITGDTITDLHGPSFDGPLAETVLTPAPTKPETFSYWANVHDSLGAQGLGRTMSLNFNNLSGWSVTNYRPEMFSVVLPETVRIHTDHPNASVLGTLTATGANFGGHIKVFPCSTEPPNASAVNFQPGQSTANTTLVRTDANGDFCARPSSGAHIIYDQSAVAPAVQASAPRRLLDTRNTSPTPIPAGTIVRIPTGAPGGATVWGNLTVVAPTGAGHTKTFPCDTPPPSTSTNNFVAGATTANFLASPTNAAGELCAVATADAHLVFDRSGESGSVPKQASTRLLDTRTSPPGRLPPGGIVRIATGAPAGATVLGNLTVVSPGAAGHARAFPCDTPLPNASVLNYPAGRTVPNFIASPVNAAGELCVYASADAHIIFDRTDTGDQQVQARTPLRLVDTRVSTTGRP